jgi:hypothetical protein
MTRRRAGLVLTIAAVLCGCGGGRSPTSPTQTGRPAAEPPAAPPVAPTSGVKGTMAVSSALTKTGGYQYTVRIELVESGGLAATVKAIDIAKYDYWGPYPPLAHFGPEALGDNDMVAANGTWKSQPLIGVEEVPDGYDFALCATLTLSNAVSMAGWKMDVCADSPPMPEPPAGAQFLLTGFVSEGISARLSDVTVQVQDGENAGRKTRTGADGSYTLTGLETGTFTVAFSKPGYQALTYTPELKSNLKVNMSLTRSP